MDLAFWAFERLLEGRVLLVLCNAGQVRSPTTAAWLPLGCIENSLAHANGPSPRVSLNFRLMLRHNCYFSEAVAQPHNGKLSLTSVSNFSLCLRSG